MRRKAGGQPLRPHLTTWQIEPDALQALRAIVSSCGENEEARDKVATWMASADIKWCGVLEDRPEIVNRRDKSSVLSALAEKRILLLGCGALGSAIAESVVRAGVSRLNIVDRGKVKPGLLVRQRYSDADIGLQKSVALKARLDGLGLSCNISEEQSALQEGALARFELGDFDLIIDATASAAVSHRIEEELKGTELNVPLMSVSISQAAQHGCVMVRMPGFSGGPHRIARQVKIEAFARDADHSSIKAFWPEKDAADIFQPEPGCSEPTFVGSAADIDFHAAGLLNLGIRRMTSLGRGESSADFIAAPWIDRPMREAGQLHYLLEGYSQSTEEQHGYTVLESPNAAKGMMAELRRIARVRSEKIETGGLIFGEIDDSHRHIWMDSVTGPPPDSLATAEKFLCGVSGNHEIAEQRARATGRSSKFIGIWHTHPVSQGEPSRDDLIAMVQLLHGQKEPPRHVVMLIVGFSASKPSPRCYLYRRDQFQVIEMPTLMQTEGQQ